MIFYIDASAVLAVVGDEVASLAVDRIVRSPEARIVISDFAIAESSAVLARDGRVGRWADAEMERLYRDLDIWTLGVGEKSEITPTDLVAATAFVRLPGVTLRAPDAIHIAAAQRIGATLLTLDRGMARAADVLGVPCINPAEADAPGDLKD